MEQLVKMDIKDIRLDNLILAILSSPKSSDVKYKKIEIKPVIIKGILCYQIHCLTNTQVFHQNIDGNELINYIESELINSYKNGVIYTNEADYSLFCNRLGVINIKRSEATKELQPLAFHNRQKNYLLPINTFIPFLYELDIITLKGTLKKDKTSKFKQINRFLEFIQDIIPSLNSNELNIIDFGCGKSYLTFAIHYYLSNILNRKVTITGIDLKEDVINSCNNIVKKYGLEGIKFIQGNIIDYKQYGDVDLVVSLHACDTATDYALYQAIKWQSKVIMAVPCCHHEVNKQAAKFKKDVYKEHGIIQERLSSLVTDLYRSELLVLNGYKTHIMEFIELEHTPKNMLIRAIKNDSVDKQKAAKHLKELREEYDICQTLEKLLAKK